MALSCIAVSIVNRMQAILSSIRFDAFVHSPLGVCVVASACAAGPLAWWHRPRLGSRGPTRELPAGYIREACSSSPRFGRRHLRRRGGAADRPRGAGGVGGGDRRISERFQGGASGAMRGSERVARVRFFARHSCR